MIQARFDKFGKQLPDTGYGCGCELCARANAPRYDRRRDIRSAGSWGPLRRRLAQMVRSLTTGRPQAA
ncbi:MAG: hypothetical protein M3082_22455 [Candidatus Dormibacteraeota bacterium]|nr:hypothetical protein [Candidatus Dormibacteraeota bacterium]